MKKQKITISHIDGTKNYELSELSYDQINDMIEWQKSCVDSIQAKIQNLSDDGQLKYRSREDLQEEIGKAKYALTKIHQVICTLSEYKATQFDYQYNENN